jgi:D-ribose pyranose/furanose isomerase RbsD
MLVVIASPVSVNRIELALQVQVVLVYELIFLVRHEHVVDILAAVKGMSCKLLHGVQSKFFTQTKLVASRSGP